MSAAFLLLINDTADITTVPSFGDQEMLPKVTAFMLESLRWRPVSIGGASIPSDTMYLISDTSTL